MRCRSRQLDAPAEGVIPKDARIHFANHPKIITDA